MTRCLTIIPTTESKIIFIGVHNDRTTLEVLGPCMTQTPSLGYLFLIRRQLNISKIALVALAAGSRRPSVIRCGTHVLMTASPLAAFATQIARLMNMETVFAHRKLCKFRRQIATSSRPFFDYHFTTYRPPLLDCHGNGLIP